MRVLPVRPVNEESVSYASSAGPTKRRRPASTPYRGKVRQLTAKTVTMQTQLQTGARLSGARASAPRGVAARMNAAAGPRVFGAVVPVSTVCAPARAVAGARRASRRAAVAVRAYGNGAGEKTSSPKNIIFVSAEVAP